MFFFFIIITQYEEVDARQLQELLNEQVLKGLDC